MVISPKMARTRSKPVVPTRPQLMPPTMSRVTASRFNPFMFRYLLNGVRTDCPCSVHVCYADGRPMSRICPYIFLDIISTTLDPCVWLQRPNHGIPLASYPTGQG